MSDKSRLKLSNEALSYYNRGEEEQRLSKDEGKLEFARTQELLSRFLPAPPAVIFDVGGGSGVYAFWLAQQGYEV
ncbi:MAG: class I SAM-dependent methyltransferase, partial [Okeania sp. SIO2H7]|nr:class I SAM-dependent methyltransferase [Okeania sp. SIO2H7]